MLDANLKAQLQTYLQNLKSTVELAVFLDEGLKSKELNALAIEIAAMSPLINLVELDGSS